MPNVIYRGPVTREPVTITGTFKVATHPGTFVACGATGIASLEKPKSSKGGRVFLVQNSRFKGQTIKQPYAAGESGVAFRIEPEQEYYAQLADGSYAPQAELAVGTDGRLKAAAAGEQVVAYFDEAKARTISGGNGWADVVIANSYTKQA